MKEEKKKAQRPIASESSLNIVGMVSIGERRRGAGWKSGARSDKNEIRDRFAWGNGTVIRREKQEGSGGERARKKPRAQRRGKRSSLSQKMECGVFGTIKNSGRGRLEKGFKGRGHRERWHRGE